jgi:hypothetical protein
MEHPCPNLPPILSITVSGNDPFYGIRGGEWPNMDKKGRTEQVKHHVTSIKSQTNSKGEIKEYRKPTKSLDISPCGDRCLFEIWDLVLGISH